MNIVTRAGWDARPPRSVTAASWAKRDTFVTHYGGTGTLGQSPRQIQNFHMDTRGWSDIAYNWLVDHHGTIYEGRGWDRVGSHTADHNTHTVGVCFIGGEGDATPAARAAIRWLYDEAVRLKGGPLLQRGHRDFNPTECPGDDLYAWVRSGMDGGDDMSLADDVFGVAYDGTNPPVHPRSWAARVLEGRLGAALDRIQADVEQLKSRPAGTVVLTPEAEARIIAAMDSAADRAVRRVLGGLDGAVPPPPPAG